MGTAVKCDQMQDASKSISALRGDHGVTIGDLSDFPKVTRFPIYYQWVTRRGDLVTLETGENIARELHRGYGGCVAALRGNIGNLGHPSTTVAYGIAFSGGR